MHTLDHWRTYYLVHMFSMFAHLINIFSTLGKLIYKVVHNIPLLTLQKIYTGSILLYLFIYFCLFFFFFKVSI